MAENLDKKYDVVAILTDIAKAAVKEKVTRVVVATFRVKLIVQYLYMTDKDNLEPARHRAFPESSFHVCYKTATLHCFTSVA